MSKHGEIIDGIVESSIGALRMMEEERRIEEQDKRTGYYYHIHPEALDAQIDKCFAKALRKYSAEHPYQSKRR